MMMHFYDLPIPEGYEFEEAPPRLYEAIGRITSHLSYAEYALIDLFKILTGLESEISHAILRDVRMPQVQRMVRDIAQQKWSNSEENANKVRFSILSEQLDILSECREKRNKYVHWLIVTENNALHIRKPMAIAPSPGITSEPLDIGEIMATAESTSHAVSWIRILPLPVDEWRRIADELLIAAAEAKRQRAAENGLG